jgi:hypothetical protein
MTRPIALLLALAIAIPATAAAEVAGVSEFMIQRPATIGARLAPGAGSLLAQRTIEREWGPSDDSVYVVLDIPGLKSEALATSLSAIIPGAGQLYSQEGSGWLFAAIEAAGWGGWFWYRHDGRRLRDEAATLAGSPDDPASAWSFDRWATTSGSDPGAIAALYAGDREAFYNAIASDPRYASGWADADERAAFGAMRIRSDARLTRARTVETALWFNHLIAAVDALRAARFHNLPLRQNLGIRIGGSGAHGRPSMAVALETRF